MEQKTYYVYILSNKRQTVLYCGITSDLIQRVWQHKHKLLKGFTQKYNVSQLVYFESFDYVLNAIDREKQIKGLSKRKKWAMIDSFNEDRKDLFTELL